MSETPGRYHVEEPGPTEMRDPLIRQELKRASVWIGLALLIFGVAFLSQPLLLIVGGLVFASMLDGGTRLLGRIWPVGRGWRLTVVTLVTVAFLAGTIAFAGMEIARQAGAFRSVITEQVNRGLEWAATFGFVPGNLRIEQILEQVMGSLGRLTYAITSVVGAITSLFLILVIGLFIAVEPRLYERGVGWMLPMRSREGFYRTVDRMAFTLRRLMAGRLLGMAVEGVGTWALLWLGGVPMAALLGVLTGVLAFLPNIGAIISGVLIILVGFSAGFETGIWAIAVYGIVQIVDGYLIVPYVAKKTVDLAPALVLGAQLLFGAMFGILGLALADPIVAMAKAALQQKSEEEHGLGAGTPEP
jgi:predicted PurR-regulated permease PerM